MATSLRSGVREETPARRPRLTRPARGGRARSACKAGQHRGRQRRSSQPVDQHSNQSPQRRNRIHHLGPFGATRSLGGSTENPVSSKMLFLIDCPLEQVCFAEILSTTVQDHPPARSSRESQLLRRPVGIQDGDRQRTVGVQVVQILPDGGNDFRRTFARVAEQDLADLPNVSTRAIGNQGADQFVWAKLLGAPISGALIQDRRANSAQFASSESLRGPRTCGR